MKVKQISLSFLLVFIISFLVLYPSFQIGLFGDDWLAIFRYVVHVLPPGGWNIFSYYLTPYGSQDILMGILYQNFRTDAFYFEVTAYFLRLLAAFSLYPVVFHFTKSKLATFFACLFFSVTTIGFDSTGWLLTMPTYLTIAFFNLFLYYYVLNYESNKIKFLLIAGVFYYLAYITASARMIGAPLFIFSLEIFWLLQNHLHKDFKNALLRISLIIAIMLLIALSGYSLGSGGEWLSRLNASFIAVNNLFSQGRTEFLLYPIVTVGGMFIPNFSLPEIQINTKNDMILSVTLPVITLFFFLLLILRANIDKFKNDTLIRYSLIAILWIFIVFVFRKLNIINFSSSGLILMAIAGGLSIIIWGILAIKYRSQETILNALFISFSWTISSFFIAWFWNPASYIDTTHRYLTTSAVGISIFLAIIISLGKKLKNQLFLMGVLSMLLILHLISTRTYINKLIDSHSQRKIDQIWSSLPYIPETGKEPVIFYFESDDNSRRILGDSVLFGFPFHISLLYNLNESDKIPASITEWKDVVSAVNDGQSLKPYGYPLEPISIDRVYGFRLESHGDQIKVFNITQKIQQHLKQELDGSTTP